MQPNLLFHLPKVKTLHSKIHINSTTPMSLSTFPSSPVSLNGSISLMHAHSTDSTIAVFHLVSSETWIDVHISRSPLRRIGYPSLELWMLFYCQVRHPKTFSNNTRNSQAWQSCLHRLRDGVWHVTSIDGTTSVLWISVQFKEGSMWKTASGRTLA